MNKSTAPTADDVVAFVEMMCLVNSVGTDPTWDEVRAAMAIRATKGGAAAKAFLEHCVPSPARDCDSAERKRDR